MSLSKGTGPFGERPAGVGNYTIESPAQVLYFDPCAKRVRVVFAGEVVADSTETKLLHETGHLPVYYFPRSDVRSDLLRRSDTTSHCPFKGDATYWSIVVGDETSADALWGYETPVEPASFLADHVAFYFERVDAWLEEDEAIFVHPRDPYARIDVLPSSRHVRVSVDGVVLAETTRPRMLFETSLPPRYYVSKDDARMDLLERGDLVTHCAYKGRAVHYSAPSLGARGENVAWCYEEPNHDAHAVAGFLAFYDERTDVEVDGRKQERPRTQWSDE
ncbi:MAG TPA: DUF427 domain-containing protein [Actinomycetota bacterium]|nr:DUF427 domain-containing protein [Actinomycetota bacterium]